MEDRSSRVYDLLNPPTWQCPVDVEKLHARIKELEAELAESNAALSLCRQIYRVETYWRHGNKSNKVAMLEIHELFNEHYDEAFGFRAAALTAGPVKLKGTGHPATPDGMDKLKRVVKASNRQAELDSCVDGEVMREPYRAELTKDGSHD